MTLGTQAIRPLFSPRGGIAQRTTVVLNVVPTLAGSSRAGGYQS